ncbi:ATP-binding cassette domain-containing protein [Micromonospora sp. NPDC000089]|uniref:ATP-binding cassette domain-containing protein n=1 Tax=unclassified Micromonospora TaxID=2617518 RepID=UPI0036994DFE
MPAKPMILTMTDVSVSYAARRRRRTRDQPPTLSGINLEIAAGEAVAILGANGAGKTTLLRCISGLLRQSAGTVDVLGMRPHQRQRRFLTQITMISGNRSRLIQELTPRHSYELTRAIYRIDRATYDARLDDLTHRMKVAHLMDRAVQQLSLGQRVRCDLVLSLLHLPRLVLLDEPSLGLDVEGQQAVRVFLPEYCATQDAALVITSHQTRDITDIARKVVFLKQGRVSYQGDLDGLLYQRQQLSRVTLRGAGLARMTDLPAGHARRVTSVSVREDELSFSAPSADVPGILAWLLQKCLVDDVEVSRLGRTEALEGVLLADADQAA